MMDYGYSEEGKEASLGDLHLWRRILAFTAPYKFGLFAAIVISLFITIATLALPYLVQTAIDHAITVPELPTAERIGVLAKNAAIYGVIIFAVFFATFCQILTLEWVGQSVMHRIRQRLFSHLLSLDLPFFNSRRTGQLVTRLTNDIQNMNEMFTSVIVTLFNEILRLLGILVLLFMMNARLAGMMSTFVPIALLLTIFFSKLARQCFRLIRSELAKLNSFLSETLAGIAIIQLFGRQKTSKDTFQQLSAGYLLQTLGQIRLFGVFMPLTEFLSSAAIALILWYGGGEVLRQRLTIGELVAFISYMRLFFQPLRELAQKYSIVQSAMASAERIFQLLDTKSTITTPIPATRLTEIKGKIELRNIRFGYDPNNPVLQDISLTLLPGQTVALVGTTGSGKSTLVSLLLRFYDPQAGQILIDGIDSKALSLIDLRTHIGVILQDVFILQDTLLANIVMDTGTDKAQVEEILARTGMNRFVQKLPAGLDTQIGEGGIELSTGQKQLLSFARVLCRKPPILILDEATAAIDTESENILEEAIADAFFGRTSLVIAHRLSTIRRADHIVVMSYGKIIEQGSHEELLAQNGHYAMLVAMDLQDGNHRLSDVTLNDDSNGNSAGLSVKKKTAFP